MKHATTAAMLLSGRKDFAGRTDKYAPFTLSPRQFQQGSLGQAITGFGPFDVTNGMLDDSQRELAVTRLNRYRLQWRFYRGEHHLQPMLDGEKKPVYNWCNTIVDKGAEFFSAKGWQVRMTYGNEQVAEKLNEVWRANKRLQLTHTLAQYMGVTGDAFCYVTVTKFDTKGRPLPRDKWRVVYIPLNPSFCFPIFDDLGEIKSILIQYPTKNQQSNSGLLSVVITRETFQMFEDDTPLSEPQPNPFGEVNVAHFKNQQLAYSNFGVSDIEQCIPLNETYNNINWAVERIIRYHAEPTTVIYGARASTLEKGANRVWSGLPFEAKVENLILQGDLTAINTHLQRIEDHILKVASIPKVAIDGSLMPHSNTSGVSLELMFKPLIDKTDRKRDICAPAFAKINRLTITAYREIIGNPLEKLADDPDRINETEVKWSSAMPRDRKMELEIAKLEYDLGITSKASLLRQFADDVDASERTALELAADTMATLAQAREMARAEQGLPPMLSSAFLGSPYLNEDMKPTIDAIKAEDAKNAAQPTPPAA